MKGKKLAAAAVIAIETSHILHGEESNPHVLEQELQQPTAVGAQSIEVAVPSAVITATVRERAGAKDRVSYELIETSADSVALKTE